jgi:hypothetical protein
MRGSRTRSWRLRAWRTFFAPCCLTVRALAGPAATGKAEGLPTVLGLSASCIFGENGNAMGGALAKSAPSSVQVAVQGWLPGGGQASTPSQSSTPPAARRQSVKAAGAKRVPKSTPAPRTKSSSGLSKMPGGWAWMGAASEPSPQGP